MKDRFAVAEREGVLLDLETGSFFRVNESAATIAASRTRGEDPERALVARWSLPPEDARAAVRAFDEEVAAAPPAARRNPLSFVEEAGAHVLLHRGAPVLRIVAGRAEGGDEQARLWAAPHLLALSGTTVLHASAVLGREGVVAFSGSSGAGKTTLARELAARGARLVSEDLVVLDGLEVVLGGEEAIRAWARRGAGPLEAPRCQRAPLRAIRFVDAARRGPWSVEPLGAGEGLLLLLENAFAELPLRAVWRRTFEASRALAARVRLERLTVPRGLEALRQTLNVASKDL